MFGDHTCLSGVTKTLSRHFEQVASLVDDRYFKNQQSKAALDIGSNDGTQLKHYQKLGYDIQGVESSKTVARLAQEAGVPTLNEFFNEGTALSLGRKFSVINAAGVFFHLEELHSFTTGVKNALASDGVFVIQFLYMKSIMDNMAFDQIYHEHLLYYNLNTVETLLKRHGLSVFDASFSPIHGGSIIAFATHEERALPHSESLSELLKIELETNSNDLQTYRDFEGKIAGKKDEILNRLDEYKKEKKSIFGFGAPVKGNTLLNYCGIGRDYLECLVEKNELRKGLFSPGMHLPINIERELVSPPDVYFVLAWNFRQEILENNQDLLKAGTEFYFPIVPSGAQK